MKKLIAFFVTEKFMLEHFKMKFHRNRLFFVLLSFCTKRMFSLISLLLITTLLSLSQSEFPCLLVPEDATTWVPFGSGDLGIWIKPAYWKHTQTSPDASLSPTIKLLMNFIDNSIFFALSVLPGTLDVNNIKSNLENNLKKSGLEFVRIVDMHSCEVNGLSTIYVKVEGGLMQTLINYDILFYSERNTSYQLSVYSVAGVTEREEMEICDFLSGFAKSDKGKNYCCSNYQLMNLRKHPRGSRRSRRITGETTKKATTEQKT